MWYAKRGGVLEPSRSNPCENINSSSWCIGGVYCWLGRSLGEDCLWTVSGLLLVHCCSWRSDWRSSACTCGGDAEDEPARLSRSSRRRFSFLPIQILATCLPKLLPGLLTVVALGNAVLDSSAFSKVGDLGPIFIWVCGAAESTRSSVCGDIP